MDPRQQYDALINAILKAAGGARLDQYMPHTQERIREAAFRVMLALNSSSSDSKEA